MEAIDRKFKISAVSIKTKKKYTEKDSVLFLAKDALLVPTLEKYYALCVEYGVDERQRKGVELLIERVKNWQNKNIKKVHNPDVEEGKEEKRVCKPNK